MLAATVALIPACPSPGRSCRERESGCGDYRLILADVRRMEQNLGHRETLVIHDKGLARVVERLACATYPSRPIRGVVWENVLLDDGVSGGLDPGDTIRLRSVAAPGELHLPARLEVPRKVIGNKTTGLLHFVHDMGLLHQIPLTKGYDLFQMVSHELPSDVDSVKELLGQRYPF